MATLLLVDVGYLFEHIAHVHARDSMRHAIHADAAIPLPRRHEPQIAAASAHGRAAPGRTIRGGLGHGQGPAGDEAASTDVSYGPLIRLPAVASRVLARPHVTIRGRAAPGRTMASGGLGDGLAGGQRLGPRNVRISQLAPGAARG